MLLKRPSIILLNLPSTLLRWLRGTGPTSFQRLIKVLMLLKASFLFFGSIVMDSNSARISSFWAWFASKALSAFLLFSVMRSKKWLHALRKLFQILSLSLLGTWPIFFQSAWIRFNSLAVLRQSSLSLRLSAFSRRARFLARFSWWSFLRSL